MQTANCTYLQVHANIIGAEGITEAGKRIRVYIDTANTEILRRTFALEPVVGHLAHAFWHVTSNIPAPCSGCQIA